MDFLYRVPAVLIALSFHEWGHAFAAYKLGDPTARNLGRMTINPVKHIDVVGLICMILFRFGWAKPVPVNPRNFSKLRRDDILVSVAGVSVNLLLSFVSCGVYIIAFILMNVQNVALEQILWNFCIINLSLLIFNLIPVPPLDGYHVFQNLTVRIFPPRFFMTLERYGSMILAMLLISGAVDSIFRVLLTAMLNGFLSLWGAMLGLT